MLITYDGASGTVLDNTGTSSAYPEGPPDEVGYVNTDAAGHPRTGLALLRLHDTDDAEQVSLALTRAVRVEGGRLVDAGELPTDPAPPPAPDPDAELVAAISAATTLAQLKDALIGKGRPAAVAGRGKST